MELKDIKESVLKAAAKIDLELMGGGDTPMELDSLSLMMLIYECETEFKIKFGLNDIDKGLSLNGFCGIIFKKLNGRI
jgi:acyl carrier protein